MKYMRYYCLILLFTLLILLPINECETVFAMDTGFSTEKLTAEKEDMFRINASISLLKEEPQKKAIKCFDVSEDEMIAVGYENIDKKIICVYTNESVFQYGYEFKTDGSFGVEWSGDSLIIYFVRSDVAVSVNPAGEVEEVLKIQNTIENNSYWNDSVFATKRNIGDTEYRIKNNMSFLNLFASSYSCLIAVKANGEERVIYDVSTSQIIKMSAIFIFVVIFIFLTILYLVRLIRKSRNEYIHSKTTN